jgi:hypothetical protein
VLLIPVQWVGTSISGWVKVSWQVLEAPSDNTLLKRGRHVQVWALMLPEHRGATKSGQGRRCGCAKQR